MCHTSGVLTQSFGIITDFGDIGRNPYYSAPSFRIRICCGSALLRRAHIYAGVSINGLLRESNPGPLAPEARIMPLDQAADGTRDETVSEFE